MVSLSKTKNYLKIDKFNTDFYENIRFLDQKLRFYSKKCPK